MSVRTQPGHVGTSRIRDNVSRIRATSADPMSPEVSIEPFGLARCERRAQLLADLVLSEPANGQSDRLANRRPE